jgi:ankyrin repeat protein
MADGRWSMADDRWPMVETGGIAKRMAEIDALVDAAKAGDLGRVRRLVDANFLLASQRLPSGETPLMAALYRGHGEIVEALIQAGAEIDVFAAAATGRVDDLRRTLDEGAVDAVAYDGWTPLHLAAFFGHVEAVRLLLDAGAAVAAVSANSLRNTPLHAATAGKHIDAALLLLEHGADPRATDSGGYSALEIARQNQLDSVVAAISAGRR